MFQHRRAQAEPGHRHDVLVAFKHVRLFLKNRFGDPGDDVKALEESQKREGCSMTTSTSEFVLRFGADDKNKHYRDVSFRDVKKFSENDQRWETDCATWEE